MMIDNYLIGKAEIRSTATELSSKVDDIKSNYTDITSELSNQKLEQEKIKELIIDSELRNLQKTNDIYDNIKCLAAITENSEKKLLELIKSEELKNVKTFKKIKYGLYALGSFELILLCIQILTFILK